jgi:hypothetical protein
MRKSKKYVLTTRIRGGYDYAAKQHKITHNKYYEVGSFSNKTDAANYLYDNHLNIRKRYTKQNIKNNLSEVLEEYDSFYYVKDGAYTFGFISKESLNSVFLHSNNIVNFYDLNELKIINEKRFNEYFNTIPGKLELTKKKFSITKEKLIECFKQLKESSDKATTAYEKYHKTMSKEKTYREGYVLIDEWTTRPTNVVYEKTREEAFKHFRGFKRIAHVKDNDLKKRIFKCYILGDCDLYFADIKYKYHRDDKETKALLVFSTNNDDYGSISRFKYEKLYYDEPERFKIENITNLLKKRWAEDTTLKSKDSIFVKFLFIPEISKMFKNHNIEFHDQHYKKIKKILDKNLTLQEE